MAIGVVANTNVPSISASRILANNRNDLERAMTRLSSGKRINSASDDAAGMAVAAKLRADVRSLNQAVRNANDAVSLVNTYDGASAEVESILVRMRELAVQSANGTYQDEDRDLAQLEIDALASEIDRIADNTTFNHQNIADGGSSSAATFTFRVGPQSGSADDVDVELASLNTADLGSTGVGSLSIGSAGGASDAVDAIDSALAALSEARAKAGAFVNRLGHTVSNLQNVSQRTQEALSGIEDADYAAESAALARGTVLAQAGTAMLAQANQSPQYILTLLRG
jgi:flagellin